MKRTQFLRAVQGRTARMSVTSSSARGQGKGTVEAGRDFLADLNLAVFGTARQAEFARRLDAKTDALQAALPRRTAAWGTARKLLNIFLRESLYTQYLSEAFHLNRAEAFLEVPLDSITTSRLQPLDPTLPRWRGVKHVTREVSDAYQRVAQAEARRHGWARVHLDALWWGLRTASRRLTMR